MTGSRWSQLSFDVLMGLTPAALVERAANWAEDRVVVPKTPALSVGVHLAQHEWAGGAHPFSSRRAPFQEGTLSISDAHAALPQRARQLLLLSVTAAAYGVAHRSQHGNPDFVDEEQKESRPISYIRVH